ncbi:UDP-N-acetylglucosamine 1-carboxyvinyltransferase MurA [Poriferisphaera corsica]|uniref:UDP-N-acetylglucosamine 1-carboxyvinyltransferase n=1 Tax=Poriferisphaera corsica TaxID=2528020 RepID=A0A517YPH7_9BACT|nr:UDP-N-acetylglucosamine 1-carboxyvinyltransferase [Poriferisphaera corsica]QDU32127.1 UDP-N-acetylglucosamine 1-carboxyvinyltransferase MurA [Poriferisphaera corsica]
MDAFVIQGGKRLTGTVRIHGSKNAALPLMAAALLTDQPLTLKDVPDLSDIRNMVKLLKSLGCTIDSTPDLGTTSDGLGVDIKLHATDPSKSLAHYDIVRTMRAGICALGPLLAKRGYAKVSMPGGCAIGDRPVDLHIRGLQQLGAKIHLAEGYIIAEGPNGPGSKLQGAHVFLGGPNGSTVLGTANVLSAAALAEGTTIIECAACEPEIEDLANLLNSMGAKITGAGSPVVTVEGVDELTAATHTIMPDRIEAGTYVIASAITNGDVILENFPTRTLTAALDRLRVIGVDVTPIPPHSSSTQSLEPITTPDSGTPIATLEPKTTTLPGLRDTVRIATSRRLEPAHVVTQPHPGFPTDLQAQLMALLTLADGNSVITEKIFPDRFLHVPELLRMGASLTRIGPSVMVTGVRELIGAPVMASDLRASAGLVLAGLAARGTTTINRVYHLDRGYQRMELTLQKLGADIQRVKGASV